MAKSYLHERRDFSDLLGILGQEKGIQIQLIEKDYWIMHVLYGLKKQGFEFELKGGTSLSKGYQIINRFSEDIDLHIKSPTDLTVNENPKSNKSNAIQSRKDYYDWLASNIRIDGIVAIERDPSFDDTHMYRSGGIRLLYESKTSFIPGVKDGILLEVGFDTITPNQNLTISSWAFDRAFSNPKIEIHDNRAINIACYHPGYTFVEKLQTVATKFRLEQESGQAKPNMMRHYYDLYCLLENTEVLEFIGTEDYFTHKQARFPKQDIEIPIEKNEAFLLTDSKRRADFKVRYEATSALYYQGQPKFEELLIRLEQYLPRL